MTVGCIVLSRFVFRSVLLGLGLGLLEFCLRMKGYECGLYIWCSFICFCIVVLASRVLLRFSKCSYLASVVAACRGMSTSSNGSNSGDSGASFGGLRLEFLSTSSESLHIEVEREVHEDLASEHAESLWPRREGYDWVAEGVRECCSKYRWSRLLRSWLNSVYLFERGADTNVVSIERVSG